MKEKLINLVFTIFISVCSFFVILKYTNNNNYSLISQHNTLFLLDNRNGKVFFVDKKNENNSDLKWEEFITFKNDKNDKFSNSEESLKYVEKRLLIDELKERFYNKQLNEGVR